MPKMCVARSTKSAVSGWLRKSPMFTPSVSQTCTAYRLGGWPRTACTPAEATSMSLRLPSKRRNNPSAIGLRQILPVQTKRTLFTISRRACERADKVGLNGNKVNRMRRLATDRVEKFAAAVKGVTLRECVRFGKESATGWSGLACSWPRNSCRCCRVRAVTALLSLSAG